jgi:hypothetical protein
LEIHYIISLIPAYAYLLICDLRLDDLADDFEKLETPDDVEDDAGDLEIPDDFESLVRPDDLASFQIPDDLSSFVIPDDLALSIFQVKREHQILLELLLIL